MNEEDNFIKNHLCEKVMEHCGEDLADIEETLEQYTTLEQTMMLGYLLSQLLDNAPTDKQKKIKTAITEVILNG
jgi:hypothetical protein